MRVKFSGWMRGEGIQEAVEQSDTEGAQIGYGRRYRLFRYSDRRYLSTKRRSTKKT